MAEKFCYSLLQATTLQLLKAAGFDSGSTASIHTLTHIFEKYLELLSSTAQAYSQHHGRTSASIFDMLETFDELGVDVSSLTNWIEEEKRSLMPAWTEQADPSRTLKDTVYKGLERQEDIIYEYGNFSDVSIETTIASSEDELELADVVTEEDVNDTQAIKDKSLPDYIPAYFPPFPITTLNEEEVIQPTSQLQHIAPPKTATDQKQNALLITAQDADHTLPMPNIVKRKARPIENPFTYLKPFEDSILASVATTTAATIDDSTLAPDSRKDQPEPLSMFLWSKLEATARNNTVNEDSQKNNPTESPQAFDGTMSRKRRNISELQQLIKKIKHDHEATQNDTNSIMQTNVDNDGAESKKPYSRPLVEGISLFQSETRNEAAPGNNLFRREDKGLLETFVTHVAPPIAIPKLLTPNLMVDMFHSPSSATSTPSTLGTKLRLNMNKIKSTASDKASTAAGARKPSLGGFTIDESMKKQQDEFNEVAVKTDDAKTPKAKRRRSSNNSSSGGKNRRTSTSSNDKGAQTLKRSKTTPISLAALAAGAGSTVASGTAPSIDKSTKRKLTIHLPKPNTSSTSMNGRKGSLTSSTDGALTASPTSPTSNTASDPPTSSAAPSTDTTNDSIPKLRFRIKLPTPGDSEQS